MSDVAALCEHRTKLCAMKAAMLSDYKTSMMASSLDGDIKRIDSLIEKALQKPIIVKPSIYTRKRP